jgi:ATP-binding cassette subfamily B protein
MVGAQQRMRLRLGDWVTQQQVKPGTVRRILPYAVRYRAALAILLLFTTADAVIAAANPLVLRMVIDNGIIPRRHWVVIGLSLTMAGLVIVDVLAIYLQAWYSARIGQGLIYDLRTNVFENVQRQSLAFFTRAQTGSLVSRLNTDVIGAQEAVTSLLSDSVATVLTMVLVLVAMFYLSWQVSIVTLAMIPVFVFAAKQVGKRLQRLTRQQMQFDAEIGSMMNERFNVAGATLAKLYGRPDEEARQFARRAARVRDVTILTNVYGRGLPILAILLVGLTTAVVYGLGGSFVISGGLQVGTLVALVTLLARVYAPIYSMSNMQVNLYAALVSFDRVFEVLDLKPLIAERPGAYPLPAARPGGATAPGVEFDQVCFRYPAASEVSLASLESIELPGPERAEDAWILREVSFSAPAGKLTALVGPSGAGKTTITHLVPRLYDPESGQVRIGGHDVRELTLRSLHDTIGVVTQDAYLFHDTIRTNLAYARPGATEQDMLAACEAARIRELIGSLPNGLDTVVGDRGYRLSGGEKQRLALARLLLKAPPVVVLDEATAHLDSESEAAIQRALTTALAGRTSLVIAHRLSTVRGADQILVVDSGQIAERGTHEELLASGRLYAELYRTQFAHQAAGNGQPARRAIGDA